MRSLRCLALAALTLGAAALTAALPARAENQNPRLPNGWRVHDMTRPAPERVEVKPDPAQPPSDAAVLFDGSGFAAWEGASQQFSPNGEVPWKLADGVMEIAGQGGVRTKEKFGDIQLHLEWASPNPHTGEAAQRRGNSGVFLMGRYEIQIMDGFENDAYADGMMGAVYGQTPPMVNACRRPGEWQTFDIFFTAPKFAGGETVEPAYVTVLHNGVLVQNHTPVLGATQHNLLPHYTPHAGQQPIVLQNHGEAVRLRNIWVRRLNDRNTRPAPTQE
ncbi:hypothetical protein Pla175_49620 [Pirellulimonas nuda]|uniref:3-keto-alpha-glucoside-1,2-lyase/3-keto-2-hydroxy-glucal hydratase domain-containing protein n=1 Tax=Pirellulimonas nuda TaxID=2528009 RepID=A0A518DJ87_9BACT|nr:DUF1080 domain-containing protein [Pirellulimonas nuda]QDU91533.1 hypothetical protein Pla175_49620 [Pirellulimonas nuda]